MLENQLAALEHEEKLERNKLFEDRDAAIELLQEVGLEILLRKS